MRLSPEYAISTLDEPAAITMSSSDSRGLPSTTTRSTDTVGETVAAANEGSIPAMPIKVGYQSRPSSPRATEYLHTYYTPTGRLTRPMLAIHTTYDPLVPPWIPNAYSVLTETMGTKSLFVQQYVKHDGHCAINSTEVSRGFTELREWKNRGVRPAAGANQ